MRKPFSFLWSSVKPKFVDVEELNETLDFIKSNKYKERPFKNMDDAVNSIYKYSIKENEKIIEIHYTNDFDNHNRIVFRKLFEDDKLKQSSGITGMEAYEYVEDLFQKTKKTSTTLYKAFSGQKYINEYKLVKKCVPKQIGYITPYADKTVVKNCFKADVSSAFPSQMTKDLPTFHDCICSNGILEPTEDYPFAFYTKSGHIKIYNELDTHDMKNDFYTFYNEVYNDSIKAEEEYTILCRKSEYSLKEEFEYMYSQRKTDINQKMYMNACIGFFHRNGDPRLSLLAAVVIARNNNEMLNRVKQLEEENNGILYIATDCIIWRGNESTVATDEKYLGSFTYEGRNGKFYGVMVGAYQFLSDEGLTTKCSYLKNDEDKLLIPFGKLPEPKYSRFMLIGDDETGRKLVSII